MVSLCSSWDSIGYGWRVVGNMPEGSPIPECSRDQTMRSQAAGRCQSGHETTLNGHNITCCYACAASSDVIMIRWNNLIRYHTISVVIHVDDVACQQTRCGSN